MAAEPTQLKVKPAAAAVPSAQPAPPSRPAPKPRARDQDVRLRETRQGDWHVTVPQAHTREDCLRPEYLSHRMRSIAARDRLFFEHHDWSLVAIVLRTDVDLGLVFAAPEHFTELRAATLAAADASELTVEEMMDGTFRVRREHDVAVDGLPTRAAADRWIADRQRAWLS